MLRIASVFGLLSLGLACEVEYPCDRYALYMCTCHDDDPSVDCSSLEQLAENADGVVQDQCQADLNEQRDIDFDAGLDCDI